MEFHQVSYESHQHIKHESKLIETWKNKKTVDYWRHQRMYNQLTPLLQCYPKSKWLTVGDGRYGTDANYLEQFGINVIASDINETCMKQAKKDGFISAYAVENAEKLSFDDNHFDFVLCKESYHHFPRPMIALYEMLRVSKNGVILIEPNDQSILETYTTGLSSFAFWYLFACKQWIKKIIGKKTTRITNRYEPMGNYVYTISKREMEKAALGLNFEALATKGMNDFYVDGVEFEEVDENGPLFKQVKETIGQLDSISEKRPETYGLLIAIIFKKLPDLNCCTTLKSYQFDIQALERNPYIKL